MRVGDHMKTYTFPIYNSFDDTWLIQIDNEFITISNEEYEEKYANKKSFEQELREVYNDLSNGQEPLGEEFEKIWDENVDDLYEE